MILRCVSHDLLHRLSRSDGLDMGGQLPVGVLRVCRFPVMLNPRLFTDSSESVTSGILPLDRLVRPFAVSPLVLQRSAEQRTQLRRIVTQTLDVDIVSVPPEGAVKSRHHTNRVIYGDRPSQNPHRSSQIGHARQEERETKRNRRGRRS